MFHERSPMLLGQVRTSYSHTLNSKLGEVLIRKCRRLQATLNAGVFSIITDGMQAGHSLLPYVANNEVFNHPIIQKIQGVIEHGQETVCIQFYV